MPYTVRANGFEVVCDTLEEVRTLVGMPAPTTTAKTEAPFNTRQASDAQTRNPQDYALLKALVDSESGVRSSIVEGLLKSHGKGMPGATDRWCERIGIPRGSLERTIVARGVRGWKLTDPAFATAKVILGI
jgi:hypothetical protein